MIFELELLVDGSGLLFDLSEELSSFVLLPSFSLLASASFLPLEDALGLAKSAWDPSGPVADMIVSAAPETTVGEPVVISPLYVCSLLPDLFVVELDFWGLSFCGTGCVDPGTGTNDDVEEGL